jgi:hypothetical protein
MLGRCIARSNRTRKWHRCHGSHGTVFSDSNEADRTAAKIRKQGKFTKLLPNTATGRSASALLARFEHLYGIALYLEMVRRPLFAIAKEALGQTRRFAHPASVAR